MRMAAGAAPGKVVLFGEHSVVYGRPAVAATLGLGLGAVAERDPDGPTLRVPAWGLETHPKDGKRRLDAIDRAFATAIEAAGPLDERVGITVDGELPPGVGLGSSAAFAVSILRALAEWRGRPFSPAELLAAAEKVETVFHGTPSGLDHTVVASGGCLRFQGGSEPPFKAIRLAQPVPVVVAWTAREGSTKAAVADLRVRVEAHPAVYERLFDTMGDLAEAGIAALERGDHAELGALFDIAHGCLNACGVSGPENEQMVRIARRAGALGAKLTGAGWGGAMLAVAAGDVAEAVVTALEEAGFEAFATQLGC